MFEIVKQSSASGAPPHRAQTPSVEVAPPPVPQEELEEAALEVGPAGIGALVDDEAFLVKAPKSVSRRALKATKRLIAP